MADATYSPPEIWSHDAENGGKFANINRPTAGPRADKELPIGKHDLQLYSLATPNGVKASILLEELLEAGHSGAEYDAWTIDIGSGEQFGSGFVDLNPNSKIPTLLDRSGAKPVRVFESGAILIHLAEKFGAFMPADETRAEVLSWLFWQVGSAPFIGGGFGHFYAYAPEKYEYPINRYAMETKRLFDVADKRLAESQYLGGDDYTVADIATFPWLAPFVFGGIYGEARKFLSIHEYRHVDRWVKAIAERPAVKRGRIVNKTWGEDDEQLRERHSAADFEGKAL
ncbi:MAG: glutathione-dependent disulfide-bond oxidoreductase [Alphaproteobacteria bacterium]|nr:glutathione-dependent disulfide-bond oxidoreductase [Alphaproteobacteria bacterium]MBU1607691.1 glutathione-dependent disulfide-bond oxidoreductase [Alphaproteobacteria bacterium]MBU2328176.1 glutathione-dependent disulfide-bond oxidoreductase [Alphaproteobacteria bacterium]